MTIKKSTAQIVDLVLVMSLLFACGVPPSTPTVQPTTAVPLSSPVPVAPTPLPTPIRTPAPTVDVTSTARAILSETNIAIATTEVTATAKAWSLMATARAPTVNARGTEIATSLKTPFGVVGVLVSMPSEIKWKWSGNYHKWEWDVILKEPLGRPITITYRTIEVYTVDGHAYDTVDSLNVVIPANGMWKDHVQITERVGGNFHDSTCLLTYNGSDEKVSWLISEGVTKLRDEKE